MLRFLLRRSLESFLVLLVMSFIVYGLMGLMPGDPIDLMISADPRLTSADAARLKALYGLDQPILTRYGNWLQAALSGDFGYSRTHNKPVFDILWPHLARTLMLLVPSMILSTLIAIPLGVWAASRQNSLIDYLVNFFSFAGKSIPPFWLALLLILLFAVTLKWLPSGGTESIGSDALGDRLAHLALPVLTLTLLNIATIARLTRAEMLGTLRFDYIRTARAKGASRPRVLYRHALRNAMIPVVTILALELGGIFSGALITETVFAYPGMGKLIYDSILGNDFNLALIGLLLATLFILLANLLADMAYSLLDPRVRLS